MTRLIKLMIIVAVLASSSVLQAQLFDEDYTGGAGGGGYIPTNGVEVTSSGLNVSNSAAIFMYTNSATYGGDGTIVTNAQVEFTIKPVLNDAMPADVGDAAVVFWVNTSSNVSYLQSNGVDADTVGTDSNVNVLVTNGKVTFVVKINYETKTFTLTADGTPLFNGDALSFYSTVPTELTKLEIRETSSGEEFAVVELFEVYMLDDDNNVVTSVTGADIKVYKKGDKVYVELNVTTDGTPTYFTVSRDGGWESDVIEYVNGQSVYMFVDASAVLDQIYEYRVLDVTADGQPTGAKELKADVKIVPMVEATSLEMTEEGINIAFASVSGETYQIIGLASLMNGDGVVLAEVDAAENGNVTSLELDNIGDSCYFKIIKK